MSCAPCQVDAKIVGIDQTIPTTGPFCVKIAGYRPALHGDPATYAVNVAGKDGTHWVRRRYTDFKALRSSMGAQAADLPALPPRSFFRQRISAKFQTRRFEALGILAAAAMDCDPLAVNPGVRDFLGLDAPTRYSVAAEDLRQPLDGESVEFWEQRREQRRCQRSSPNLLVNAMCYAVEEGKFEDGSSDSDYDQEEQDMPRATSSWTTAATAPSRAHWPEENECSSFPIP